MSNERACEIVIYFYFADCKIRKKLNKKKVYINKKENMIS